MLYAIVRSSLWLMRDQAGPGGPANASQMKRSVDVRALTTYPFFLQLTYNKQTLIPITSGSESLRAALPFGLPASVFFS